MPRNSTTDRTAANSRGLNVDPISSVLPLTTRDVDASGLTQPPLDGEFLIFGGRGKAPAKQADGTPDLFDTLASQGGNARMVWGHANRADRTGSGKNRTPVILSKAIIKLSLYNYDLNVDILPGDLVVLKTNVQAVGGSAADTRFIADIQPISAITLDPTTMEGVWVVGTVLEGAVQADLVAAADGSALPLTIELYENPYFLPGIG